MTTFDALGLPIFETTDKIAATGDGLREDLNLIGSSSRNAITAEGTRAEGAAKSYADTKDTSNRAAWAAADTAKLAEAKAYTDERDEAYRTVDRALWRTEDDEHQAAAQAYTDTEVAEDRARLAALEGAQAGVNWDKGSTTADLNTLQTSGRYTVNITTVANQPVAAAGSLEVLWGVTTGQQRYTVRETNPRVFYRTYSSNIWGPWSAGGDLGARVTAIEASNTPVLITNGSFRDGFTGWSTTTGWVTETNGVTSWARAVSGSAGLLTQSVVIPAYLQGKTLRLTMLTDCTSTGTFRARITTAAGVTDQSFVLATGPWTARTVDVPIPANQGATPITVEVGRSAGNVYMTGVRFEVL